MLNCLNFFFICLIGSASSQCGSNWVVHENSCYHFSHDAENWPDAYFVCKIYDSHLVEIDSASEDNFLMNTAKVNGVWIGLSDLIGEGEWLWVASNKRPSYTRWYPGEPNNFAKTENCAIAYDAGWNDLACNRTQYYVCEKEMEESQVIG